nr:hypothetical protein [Vibrio sp. 04Ya108]
MVFDDLNFATSAVVFSALCFITYFIVKAVVKSKRQDDINYANEDMMSFRFKLDQDVSAGVKTRIAINHIHYTVLARSNYNRTCQVMVYDVVDGVLLITSNIPSHEFAGEETIWGDIENPKLNTSDNVCDNARYNTSSSKNNPPPAVSDPTPSSNSSSASSIGDGNSCSGDSGC